MTDETPEKRTIIEEVEMKGRELVDYVQGLVEKGNVRRIVIRSKGGKTLLEIPLTAGAVVTGAVAIASPALAALGALAVLIAEVKVEIERDEDEAEAEVVDAEHEDGEEGA